MCKNVITKVFVVLAVLTLGNYAMARMAVWDDGAPGSHLWSDGANWDGGNTLPVPGDDVRVAVSYGGNPALLNSSANLGGSGQTKVYYSGILDVDGSSGSLTNYITTVGYTVGGGVMNVTNGATVTATRASGTGIYVGNAGSASTMNISGAGTSVSAGDEISIALFGGSGTIDVSSGGTLSAGGRLAVGGTGNGTLTINGGTVNSTLDSIIGRNSGANGTVVMNSGAWNVTTPSDSGRIIFGAEDGTSGTLNMSGGDINAYKLILGYATGGVGTAYVDGGTIDITRHILVGLDGGSGTLNVDGGDLSINFTLFLGHNGGVGRVQLDSGSISASDLVINSLSSMDIAEGTLVLAGNDTAQVQSYVDANQITGYSDPGNVKVHYDVGSNTTTVTAVPYVAFNPSPDDSAVVPAEECDTTVLTWSPGSEAASHNVYLGTDFDNVNDANTGSPEYKANKLLGDESYDPGTLEMGTTYYWRIDEVNEPNTWKGEIWRFEVECPTADLSGDCCVDFKDFSILASQWDGWLNGSPDFNGTTIVSLIDVDLDITRQLETYFPLLAEPALVVPGPRLVVGEGQTPDNHTVIRVLNQYGVAELQFMAYPTWVTGGVNVNTGLLFPPVMSIVACPLSDTTVRQVRIFSEEGILLYEFTPSSQLDAPFAVSVGNYLLGHYGDEIAIASRGQDELNRDILIYSGEGQLLNTIASPNPYSGLSDTLVMSTIHHQGLNELLLFYQSDKKAVVLALSSGQTTEYNLSSLPNNSGVYESAFAEQLFAAGGPEAVFSTVQVIDDQQSISPVNAGVRENCFWVHTPDSHDPWDDSDYIKHGLFRHLRTDTHSPAYNDPNFNNNDYEYWAGGTFENYIDSTQSGYFADHPGMWEPTFTHRHAYSTAGPWRDVNDPETGLPKYSMLSRLNNRITYGEGASTFSSITYAFDLPALDHLYVWPLRAYVRALAEKFRGQGGQPEQLVGIEPNHEFEIYAVQDDSIGDYNTRMISGFYDHLRMLYNTHAKINSRFGTSFVNADDFDAPRNIGRGSWDSYSTSNDFFNAWVEYNRKVIFHRLAQGFRECLLAGFPPEAIKTHQIPANYAIGEVTSSRRITPIDWIFSAGTGYGGTRYSLWYQNATNWIQGAFSSGQTMTSIGEYHPLTSNQTSATNQMRYMFEHGVNFIHCMSGMGNDDVVRASYLSLKDGNLPREGTTSGVGQIRAVLQPEDSGSKPYNIVCIGTGEERTGLLKSINADGSWEGTVYVIPFHGHIDLVPIGAEEQNFHLTTTQYNTGSITGLKAGDQIEIRFKARTDDQNGMFTLLALHDGIEMPGHRHVVTVGQDWGFYRYVLRIQSPMDGVIILINSGERDTPTGYNQDIEIEEFSVLVHKERVARIEFGITEGSSHVGGVTFDVLSLSHIPNHLVPSDFNGNGCVDWADLGFLVSQWLQGKSN